MIIFPLFLIYIYISFFFFSLPLPSFLTLHSPLFSLFVSNLVQCWGDFCPEDFSHASIDITWQFRNCFFPFFLFLFFFLFFLFFLFSFSLFIFFSFHRIEWARLDACFNIYIYIWVHVWVFNIQVLIKTYLTG